MSKLQKTTKDTAYVEFTYSEDGILHAVFKRRPSKEEKKSGIVIDMDSPVLTFDLAKPDEFKCSLLSVTCHKTETKKFYEDAISLLTNIVSGSLTVFIRITDSDMGFDPNFKEVILNSGFVADPNNSDCYEYEKPITPYMSIFMCLGVSYGLLIGLLAFNNIAYMSIGIALGLCIGGGLDANARKSRKKLKEKRGNCFTKTRDEE